MTNITFVAFVENFIALPQVSVLGVFLSSSKIYLNRAILDRKSKSSKEKRLVSKSSSSSMINDSESILCIASSGGSKFVPPGEILMVSLHPILRSCVRTMY